MCHCSLLELSQQEVRCTRQARSCMCLRHHTWKFRDEQISFKGCVGRMKEEQKGICHIIGEGVADASSLYKVDTIDEHAVQQLKVKVLGGHCTKILKELNAGHKP